MVQLINSTTFVWKVESLFRLPILWTRDQIVASVLFAFQFLLIGVYGYWSDRYEVDDEERLSREKGSSIISGMMFGWVAPLIVQGSKKPIEQKDIWELIESDEAKYVLKEYYARKNPKSTLFWNLMRISYRYMAYEYCCAAFASILSFGGPFFLYQIVSLVQIPGVNRILIVPHLIGLLISGVIHAFLDGQMHFVGRRIGVRGRAVLIDELYQKSLHRVQFSTADDDQASLGKIMTLMSVDTERIRTMLSYSHNCFVQLPISIVVAIGSLYWVLGWSSFVGIGLILLLGPISTLLGKIIIRLHDECLQTTDARVTIMNELLQGIRIVKYFAWEEHFKKKIEKARTKELNSIVKLWTAYMGFNTIGAGSGTVISFATFAVYTLVAGKRLDAATAFTAVNLLRVVSDLMSYLPSEVMNILKAKVSADRIGEFLKERDIDRFAEDLPKPESEGDSETTSVDESNQWIGFRNAHFRYYGTETSTEESSANSFTLRNLSIDFPVGGLSVVAGPTGAGKTSLILALLGEMERLSGQACLPIEPNQVDLQTGLVHKVAYAAQTAWLLNATIRDNILFGEPYDEERYEQVIRGCALAKDLENLEGGDLTEIGEKGINLSGGQKQRISLARACYSRAAYVLLDDPLSAVDAPTARFLLHKSLLGLLKGRTVILVSHATHLVVPFADHVVVMKNGEVSCQGAPKDLTNDESAEGIYGLSLTQDAFDDEKEGENDLKKGVVTLAGEGTTLVQDEEKASGSVRFSIYKAYFAAAGGLFYLVFFFASFILIPASKFAADWWLKVWTDQNARHASSFFALFFGTNGVAQEHRISEIQLRNFFHRTAYTARSSTSFSIQQNDHLHNDAIFYIGVYAAFGLGVIIAANIQTIVLLVGSRFASQNLHARLLDAILYSPLRFFEVTPIGRILNRFSKDIESVDSDVIEMCRHFIDQIILGTTIITVIGTVAPIFLLVVPFISIIYGYIAHIYLTSSRELKRLESTTRSPLYAQFSETLSGVSTLRAYGAENRFAKMNRQKIDENHKPFFFMWAANRWLCLRTDIISSFVVFLAATVVVFGGVDAGWAAVTITYSLEFTTAILWAVRSHAEMEMSMNCVERIQEYIQIEQEAPAVIEGSRPDPEWPHEGTVQVKELSIRYAPDLPDVLKKVSFNILPNEKVAVVGRTGAGKSTLSLAFFRIIPLSGGSITIDGVDISTIGLFDLRSKLTIIPQDPVLFNGSLRSNLDPLDQHSDDKLWEALKRVHFMESMQQPQVLENSQGCDTNSATTESGSGSCSLDMPVAENGSNFSQGQRQLLCLARSLLQGNKIIFLDEATASVDNETDARIQQTIRSEFASSTIVCIAHRLRTIIDYDKVLVLEKGEVAEFGTPIDLIENSPVGTFRSMCEETGEFEELVEIARNSKEQKTTQ
jgi:ABC-type multidrug transport system fused ATPase/permease subunit